MSDGITGNELGRWLYQKRQPASLRALEEAIKQKTGDEITYTTIREAEKGKASLDTLRVFSRYYGMSLEFFLRLAGELPKLPDKDENIEAVEAMMRQMSPATKKFTVRLVETIAKK